MSSVFEAPPSRRPRILMPIAAAFIAGGVVAAAANRIPTVLFGSPPANVSPHPKAAGDGPRAAARPWDSSKSTIASSTLVEDRAKPVPAQRPEAIAQTPTPPPSAAPVEAAKPIGEPACEQRSWPYNNQNCSEPDVNSGQAVPAVRVIPTDKNAPATIPGPPTTATTAASAEPKASGGAAAAAPHAAIQPPVNSLPASQPPAADSTDRPTVAMPNSAPKEAKASPGGKRRAKETKPSERQRQTTQGVQDRNRGPNQRDETTGSVIVRSYVLPDGRQVSVYRTLNGRGDAFPADRGDPYRLRSVPAPSSGEDDDDD
jgi:hypothetical protein